MSLTFNDVFQSITNHLLQTLSSLLIGFAVREKINHGKSDGTFVPPFMIIIGSAVVLEQLTFWFRSKQNFRNEKKWLCFIGVALRVLIVLFTLFTMFNEWVYIETHDGFSKNRTLFFYGFFMQLLLVFVYFCILLKFIIEKFIKYFHAVDGIEIAYAEF
ncbi:unnamed protein product [Caenorhabditis brenneri]